MHWQSDRLKVWIIHALSSDIHSYCCYRFSERVSVCFEGCAPIIGCTTCLKMLLPQSFFFSDKYDSFIVLANSMMPNPSWEACSRPAGKEILCPLLSPKIYYLVHSSPQSWDAVQSTCSCNVPLIYIFPSISTSSSDFLLPKFSGWNVCVCVRCMSSISSCSSWSIL
jgi:hypothetical protein